ncbi:MAG: hypothetical protein WB815_06400 [Nitrososphaeraceae archaeon]
MIILYFILLVLLVVTIFDSDVGLEFVFAFAQNNVYFTNLSTRPLDDNKDPMTISITENAADANTVGFDTSDILEGILIITDIAGVAIVGLVIVTVYYQKRERKFDGMMEVFKLLNGKEQRESRLKLFEAYHMYKKTSDLGVFQTEIYRENVERTIDDMDEIGSLVRNGLVSKGLFFDVFWNTTIRCWNASKEFIGYRRSSRQFPHYMINFETLAKEAELYGKKYHGHASDSSVEP